jgi:hypothetical protein
MHSQTPGTGQVLQDTLEAIVKLANSGISPEDISCALYIDIEAVNRILANEPMHRARVVQQLNTHDLQTPQRYEGTLPSFIYSYEHTTSQLHRTSLVTGEQLRHRVPSYTFK